ncbi:hypothetical protein A1O1_06408 [Capronia coronata CBS 617.96]|uniref:PH domain-containing protein n=1 Tax=Capronia coronata CBS 617.96 TaxID=1182541 RepID=W9YUS9_9EURO|nr:uncharacterized protein A1O1_06408 [Capronia coronata CBS 617.96]EXJ86039.1 hypothetical protein A1O1_06408 [Capronia coronata CBS 617.96]
MSVEAPKPVEETPVAETSKAVPEPTEASTTPAETSVAPVETTSSAPAAAVASEEPAAPAAEEVKKEETPAATVPATEGVLGYKEPTLFKKFFFTKHYFWFSEEPSSTESLATFLRSEKADAKHSTAAWARETGKGLLFFAKRVEDKPTPVGIINLADASSVAKEGYNQFSFKAGSHQHRFEANTPKERDSWVLAVEKAVEEAKGLKEEIIGRESYKKNVEDYSKPAVIAPVTSVKTARSKSKEPKKSLDAATATATAAVTAPVAADNASISSSSSDEAVKTKKERSQSRKRGSIFGTLLGKKDELVEKKEEKAEAKKEVKEEKKAEAEEKKEEAKASEEPTISKAVEAAEASAAVAANAPVAAVATDKKEDKEEAAATDKKAKRASVFGNFFKHRVTSPATEKTESEATAPSDVPPVSETAPKIEEPIDTKPIDTADVTAPVDADTAASAAPVEEPATEATPAPAETAPAPKTEKKGGFLGFIKKTEAKLEGKKEQKEETKEEAAADAIAKDPVAAASADPNESAIVDTPAETKEERPARDNKRRTSLFFNKKKTETSDAEDATAEPKREKSPMPGKLIGNLVRRASKAVKYEGPKEKATATAPTTETAATTAPTAHQATTIPETSAETSEPKTTSDIVPEDVVAEPAPAATISTAPEVKAAA